MYVEVWNLEPQCSGSYPRIFGLSSYYYDITIN